MKKSLPKIYGLIGYPVKHSLSPAMHNAAFRECKIDAEYRLFEVKPENLRGFLQGNIDVEDTNGNSILAEKVEGFNITVPYKVKTLQTPVKEIAVRYDNELVVLTGAINTVKRIGDKLIYRNTDAQGFVKSLREDLKFNTVDKNILLIGCGGAGRAIIAGLMQAGMGVKKIFVCDSNKESVDSAKRHFSTQSDIVEDRLEFIYDNEKVVEVVTQCQLVVNATPIGMKEGDNCSAIDKNLLRKDLYVYDVVYNRETQLIKDAKEKKCKGVAGGLGMLLYQGVLAWEFWMNQSAPVEVMRKALNDKLGII
ncbi:MAG: shikimate dehydrogenase [Candidatus Omnitrophota bacterium]|nr:shikimate dehydrogenase [Candidatus Omnitrophota bacterium]